MADKMNSLPREQEKYRDGISIADLGGYGEHENKMEAKMTREDYDSMCRLALISWKGAAILFSAMGRTPPETEEIKLKYLRHSHSELFKFWEGTDLDPESKVMQDVFGGAK